MTTIKVYKIKCGDLFSAGGYDPRWSKRGKVWSSTQAVSSHLSLFNIIPDSWLLIEFDSEVGTTEYNAREWKLSRTKKK